MDKEDKSDKRLLKSAAKKNRQASKSKIPVKNSGFHKTYLLGFVYYSRIFTCQLQFYFCLQVFLR